MTIDGIGAVFDSVYEVCLDLDIAIGEIKEHAAVTHSVGETFGAADGEVAVELDDVLMVVGTECYGAGGSEGAHIGDYDGVEFSVIVWVSVPVHKDPIVAKFMVLGKVSGGKNLAIVEVVFPDAVGYFGTSGEIFFELELAVFIIHPFPDTYGGFFIAFDQKNEHWFAVGIFLDNFFADRMACG